MNANDVINAIKGINEQQLVAVNLFDVYQGKGVEPGFKSLAIALTLQDTKQTLEEKRVMIIYIFNNTKNKDHQKKSVITI